MLDYFDSSNYEKCEKFLSEIMINYESNELQNS